MVLRSFSGSCSVDFRLSDRGHIVLFKINPRFGGTFTLCTQAGLLNEALACIINRARLSGPLVPL
jgi:carbamoylphosphate synthase large subunit